MKNFFDKVLEEYPGSNMNQYWDHFEIFVKKDETKWGIKFTGTQEQVRKNIEKVLTKFWKNI